MGRSCPRLVLFWRYGGGQRPPALPRVQACIAHTALTRPNGPRVDDLALRVQHRVKLHTFVHASDAIAQEGCNWQLTTAFSAGRAAILTTHSHVHFYKTAPTRADRTLPAALLHLSAVLRPAELKLYQSLNLQQHGPALAVAAGAAVACPRALLPDASFARAVPVA